MTDPVIIDNLQYANWSEAIFRQMRDGNVTAVHATIAYHEDFAEVVHRLKDWDTRIRDNGDLIMPGRSGTDVRKARATGGCCRSSGGTRLCILHCCS